MQSFHCLMIVTVLLTLAQKVRTLEHNAANTRQARRVKRFSIEIHVSLGIARETTRDEVIFPNFDDLQSQTNCDVTFLCTEIFIASSFTLTVIQ